MTETITETKRNLILKLDAATSRTKRATTIQSAKTIKIILDSYKGCNLPSDLPSKLRNAVISCEERVREAMVEVWASYFSEEDLIKMVSSLPCEREATFVKDMLETFKAKITVIYMEVFYAIYREFESEATTYN